MLVYTSQTYASVMVMCLDVSCTPYGTSSREKTDNIITFAQFEEGNLLSETCENSESNDECDDDSTMPPLINEEEMNVMDSGDESNDEPMSTDMLEDIHDGSKSHQIINIIDAHYKVRDHIKQRQLGWKQPLKVT